MQMISDKRYIMIGIYFSGTGNSRYALEVFLRECGEKSEFFSIEDNQIFSAISYHDTLIFSYPVQYSNIPKILYDFIINNRDLWKGKKVFVIATMGMFSGDGAGVLARLLKRYGAQILGGLHVKMPDSICDEMVLKHSLEANKEIVKQAETKIKSAAKDMINGKPTQEGIGLWYHLAGLLGQRLYFRYKTRYYADKLKIDQNACIGCGKCERLCPMGNIRMQSIGISHENLCIQRANSSDKNIAVLKQIAISSDKCTMCYRCVNQCPKQAITLLGKKVVDQGTIEKYLCNSSALS